jgi:hypothetical protein
VTAQLRECAPARTLVAATLVACAQSASGDCTPAWTMRATPGVGHGASLYAISALSAGDAWAVGSVYDGIGDSALVQHWDGTAWRITTTPPAGSAAYLVSVAPIAPDDVWTVGTWTDAMGRVLTLAEHWDGSAWSIVPTPSPGSIASYLAAVTAVATDDVWSVGYQVTDAGVYQTLALHWNGSRWRVVPTPDPGSGDDLLNGIAAVASDDVWAAGFFESASGETKTLIAHWDGAAWSVTSSPDPGAVSNSLTAVHARARDDAWAVGSFHDGANNVSLVMHWDGASWTRVPSPNVPDSGNVLNDVHGSSAGDVWAVGYYYNTVGERVVETLALHWDGAEWMLVPVPSAARSDSSYLQGVSTLATGEAWIVGLATSHSIIEHLCAIRAGDAGFTPRAATVNHGSTALWRVPSDAQAAHSIVDGSGMGLYDSGARAPGASFAFRFVAAGTYRVLDAEVADSGMLRVSMTAEPSTGDAQTRFSLRWSSDFAPAGLVFDVQIRRPATEFTAWRTGERRPGDTFNADAGSGNYAFRARLRSISNGQFSGWSPPVPLTVSDAG